MEYFKPYEGEEPYIFISYAHADSQAVMTVVNDMHSRGYRIWYDEGIEIGSEWPECIAEHLYGAHLVIAFISPAYMQSDNCRREIHYTLSKKKKMINVFLENTQMTPGMEMQIGNIFALMKFAMKDEVFYEKLYSAPVLNSEAFAGAASASASPVASTPDRKDSLARKREELSLRKETLELEKREAQAKRLREKAQRREASEQKKREERARRDGMKNERRETLAAEKQEARARRRLRRRKRAIIFFVVFALLLGLTVAAVTVGYISGYGERLLTKPVQVTLLSGDTVAEFSEPLFETAARDFTGIAAGDIKVSDLAGLTKLYIAGDRYYFTEEEWTAATAYAVEGTLRELSDIAFFTHLDTLHISKESLSSLESLSPSNLEELYINDCKLSDLTGISALPKLRVLVTDGCPINDLGDINLCLQLKTLSLVGSRCSDFTVLKPLVKLADFSVSNCDIGEIATVRNIGNITRFSFYNCDLRGRFFKSFDREKTIVSMRLVDCELDSILNIDDFANMTELYLVNTGSDLDWTVLTLLPAIKTVYTDESLFDIVSDAVYGSKIAVELIS